MVKFILLFLFVMPFTSIDRYNDPLYKIAEAIKEDKINVLTKYMAEPVEIGLNSSSYAYTRYQAGKVIPSFLGLTNYRSVLILKSGENPDHTRYALLRLTTNKGEYEVSVSLQLYDTQYLINSLIFKKL